MSRFSTINIVRVIEDDQRLVHMNRSSVWRILDRDAIRPWRFRSWIFPPDPNFVEKAGIIVDLYQRIWQGQPLTDRDFVISADEKTSIQARARKYPSTPPSSRQLALFGHEYQRQGAIQYLAALDVHHVKLFGRCEPKTGKVLFGRLVDDVMQQEPYCSADRVFWIVSNGSSHRGPKAAKELNENYAYIILINTPVHASWLIQIEIYFSIMQRKVLTPNDFKSTDEIEKRILSFQDYYMKIAKPFSWKYTRQELEQQFKYYKMAA